MLRSALFLTLVAVLLGACVASAGDAGRPEPYFAPTPTTTETSASSASEATAIPLFESPKVAARSTPPDTLEPITAPLPRPAGEPTAPAPSQSPAAPRPPAVTAAAAAVLDHNSGQLLYDKNAERQLPPASLTKIASAVVALEEGTLDETVTVDVDSSRMRSSTVMGLVPGDQFSLRDLIYGMMLPSGNDAALAVGRHVAGSDVAFVDKMNALARRLQLRDTGFANPHGLSSRGHASSAKDLAALARYAMGLPEFREIVATPARVASGSRAIELNNINPFLYSYPGADGVKTGYTWRSGRTMLASATRDGHRLYVVLLNAPEMERDAAALMDWAFSSFNWAT